MENVMAEYMTELYASLPLTSFYTGSQDLVYTPQKLDN